MRLHGCCHCGNIAFDLTWGGDPPSLPARAERIAGSGRDLAFLAG
jgi:hypothetical protein